MVVKRKCKILFYTTLLKIAQQNKQPFSSRGYQNVINRHTNNSGLLSNSSNTNITAGKRYFSCGNNSLNMRFVQFTCIKDGPPRLGVQLSQEGDIVDVSGVDSTIPNGLVKFLRSSPSVLERAKRVVGEAKSTLHLSEVRLLPPVTAPDKVVCVGLNYRGHCDEQNVPHPKEPVFFSKFSSCIVGPHDDVKYPAVTKALDWEVELAVVMGKTASKVQPLDAMDHVFGFTVAQDISARDWQKSRNGGQWLLGKSMDTFCPLGPVVVTRECVPDPYNLRITTSINGILMQDGNTSELIHRIDHIISFLSHCVTLLPGDVILTGTPSGVGVFRKPQEFLKVGDVIESEISGIGKMRNTVV